MPRRRRRVRKRRLAALICALFVLSLLSFTFGLVRAVAEVLSDPDSRTVALESGTGRLVVAPDGKGVLVLDELDQAPAGKTYEAWIIEGGTPVPAGIFPGSDDRDRIPLEGTVDAGDVVAVTLEERRVAAPEGETIVSSERA